VSKAYQVHKESLELLDQKVIGESAASKVLKVFKELQVLQDLLVPKARVD
jgi:hypothetical protein